MAIDLIKQLEQGPMRGGSMSDYELTYLQDYLTGRDATKGGGLLDESLTYTKKDKEKKEKPKRKTTSRQAFAYEAPKGPVTIEALHKITPEYHDYRGINERTVNYEEWGKMSAKARGKFAQRLGVSVEDLDRELKAQRESQPEYIKVPTYDRYGRKTETIKENPEYVANPEVTARGYTEYLYDEEGNPLRQMHRGGKLKQKVMHPDYPGLELTATWTSEKEEGKDRTGKWVVSSPTGEQIGDYQAAQSLEEPSPEGWNLIAGQSGYERGPEETYDQMGPLGEIYDQGIKLNDATYTRLLGEMNPDEIAKFEDLQLSKKRHYTWDEFNDAFGDRAQSLLGEAMEYSHMRKRENVEQKGIFDAETKKYKIKGSAKSRNAIPKWNESEGKWDYYTDEGKGEPGELIPDTELTGTGRFRGYSKTPDKFDLEDALSVIRSRISRNRDVGVPRGPHGQYGTYTAPSFEDIEGWGSAKSEEEQYNLILEAMQNQ